MKTVTRLTAAVALALAISAPAFANDRQPVRHPSTMSQTQGGAAFASAPLAQAIHDPAAYAAQY